MPTNAPVHSILEFVPQHAQDTTMERVVHKSKSFREADLWTLAQYREMTPDERIAAARVLQRSVYGKDLPDVRATWKQTSK